MEEAPANQDCALFSAFVDNISATALDNPGETEVRSMSTSLDTSQVFLEARGLSPSGIMINNYDSSQVGKMEDNAGTLYDVPNVEGKRREGGSSANHNLPDDKSLASALEDLSFKDGTVDPTSDSNALSMNGHYSAGFVKSTPGLTPENITRPSSRAVLSTSLLPAIAKDDSRPLKINGADHIKQKLDRLIGKYQEQPQSTPLYFGNLSISSAVNSSSDVPRIPYKPSGLSASPFQKQLYIDRRSQAYIPYQQIGPNISWHDIDAQRYSLMQPQYVYQQLPQVPGSEVHRIRSNPHATVLSPTKSTISQYLGSMNLHRLGQGNDDPYWNSAILQKGSNQLNATLVDNCPCQFYPECSCGKDESCRSQQTGKFTRPYELNYSSSGFLQHQIFDKVSTRNFPEKLLTRSEGVNSVRTIRPGSVINGQSPCYIELNRRISLTGQNRPFDVHCNDSLRFDRQNSQFLSSLESDDLVLKSPQLKHNSVDEVAGRIYLLAKDQNGCRFLQRVFTEGTQEDIEKVFAEIIDHVGELMTDPFGNYLVQKLIEECNEDQRLHIIYEITKIPDELIKVSCNMHGTRAVQKVIETLKNSDQITMVVSALTPGALSLMMDANGSHVAHRCLQKLSPEYKAFLINAAIAYSFELAKDRQGCCIIQKCIDNSNEEQKNQLLYNITSSALNLSEDQYGNYVIQYILNLGIPWATSKILDELVGNYGYLSMQKCGSNVVEKCITLSPEPKRLRIIHELVNDHKLLHILLDQYGNYVIQTALQECKGALHAALTEAIKPHTAALRSNMFGRRVLSKTYLKNKQY